MSDEFFQRDANHVPITTLGLVASKPITYAAGSTGATGVTTLFTVTGIVAVNLFGFCTSDLTSAGAATIEGGVASSTASLADQVTATTIDDHMVYHDAVLLIGGQVAGHMHIVDEDLIQTIGTTTISGGTLTWYVTWVPISTNGNVAAT
ncbi:MAG: hypothetical protein HOA84_05540 [Candidatus Jacksonbacteria bacterium]|jgi:hypothetical protein|nr:hypothetical protein [Candidatus Jacksonbacteria bacterium]